MQTLTNSQAQAKKEIAEFLRDPNSTYICVSGKPGTGKSFFVKEVIAPMVGNSLALTATTNKAAAIIKGDTTFSYFGLRLKFDIKTGENVIDTTHLKEIWNEVIVVDEASMLDYKLFDIIVNASKNCKFIFVGDMNQLPAVKGGINVFQKFPVIVLTDVVRQKKQDLIDIIEEAKDNIKLAQVIKNINPSTNVELITSKDEIEDVIKSLGYQDKILAYTNNAVIAYNQWFRQLTGRSQELQEGDLVVNKSYCMSYENDREHLYAEEEGIIEEISDPVDLEFPSTGEACGFMVKAVTIQGKSARFLTPVDVGQYRNIMKILAKDKNWKDYYYLKEKIADLRDNMSCTVHAAQGSTYNNVLIDLRDIKTCKAMSVKTRLIYVALSRAKEKIYIYDK